jgi:methylated-DNA-[protein]-cysteine S-methyltransferase
MDIFIGNTTVDSFGPIWVALTKKGLASVAMKIDQDAFIENLSGWSNANIRINRDETSQALQQINEYFLGKRKIFDLPIDWETMPIFQQTVLKAVSEIPWGQVRTYGEIAQSIGRPKASRAVGGANARNPIPIIIPCHRVVGSNGKLHGYSAPGGLETKAWLLAFERQTLI